MSLMFRSLAFVLLAAALHGCGATSEERIKAARGYLGAGDPATALIELKNALQDDPDNVEARRLTAEAHLLLGDGSSAEKEIQRAIALGESRLEVMPELALALFYQNDFDRLLELDPATPGLPPQDQASLYGLTGLAYLVREDQERARQQFDAGTALDPDSVEVLAGLGWLSSAQGDNEQARLFARKAIAQDKNYPEAWRLQAHIQRNEGELKAALQSYSQFITLQPMNVGARLDRIAVNIDLERQEQAAREVRRLRGLRVESPRLDYLDGILTYQREDYATAVQLFERAVQANPNDLQSTYYAGVSALQGGRYESAALYFSRLNARNPGYVPAMVQLAWLEVRLGNYAQAEGLLRDVLAKEPENEIALNLLADALAQENRPGDSIEVLEQIVALNPQSVTAHSRLGSSMLQAGRTDEGLTALKSAKELEPERQDTAGKLVFSLLGQNRLDEALAAAQELTTKNPDSAYAQSVLAAVYVQRKDYDSADAAFNRALDMDPYNLPALSGLAGLAAQYGDAEQAKSYYRKALQKHKGHLIVSQDLAYLSALDGDVEEMVAVLETAIEVNPTAVMPRLSLARYYDGQREFDKVLELLDPVQAYSGDSWQYLKLLSNAQYRTGDFGEAQKTLSRMVQYDPNNADIRYMLATTERRNGKPRSALAGIQEVLKLQPDHIGARYQEIELLTAAGDYEAAYARVDDMQKLVGNNDLKLAQLEGSLADASGDYQRATKALRKVFEQQETNINLLNLESALWQSGEQEAALELLTDWLTKVPDDHTSKLRLAERYTLKGDSEQAVDLYRELLKSNPGNVVLLNNLAWNLRDEDRERAIEYAEEALEKAPDSPEVKSTLAVLVRESDNKRALRLIREAQRARPGNPSYVYYTAMVLAAGGKDQEAADLLRRLLNESPEFASADDAKLLLTRLGG